MLDARKRSLALQKLTGEFKRQEEGSLGFKLPFIESVFEGGEFWYGYDLAGKERFPRFQVAVGCDARVYMNITREMGFDRLSTRIGLAAKPRTGDSLFDKELFIECCSPGFVREFFSTPAHRRLPGRFSIWITER